MAGFNIADISIKCVDKGEEKDNGNIFEVIFHGERTYSWRPLLKAISAVLSNQCRADITFTERGLTVSDNVEPLEFMRDEKPLVNFNTVCDVLRILEGELSTANQGPLFDKEVDRIVQGISQSRAAIAFR